MLATVPTYSKSKRMLYGPDKDNAHVDSIRLCFGEQLDTNLDGGA
jgi:hypothetical protein